MVVRTTCEICGKVCLANSGRLKIEASSNHNLPPELRRIIGDFCGDHYGEVIKLYTDFVSSLRKRFEHAQ